MNEKISRIAQEAGIDKKNISMLAFGSVSSGEELLERFANLLLSTEKERCAKLADEYATYGGSNFYAWFKKLANEIRNSKSI